MSSTICSEKIHHPPCSLESSNQGAGGHVAPVWMEPFFHFCPAFRKKRRWTRTDVQHIPPPRLLSLPHFLKVLVSAETLTMAATGQRCDLNGIKSTKMASANTRAGAGKLTLRPRLTKASAAAVPLLKWLVLATVG